MCDGQIHRLSMYPAGSRSVINSLSMHKYFRFPTHHRLFHRLLAPAIVLAVVLSALVACADPGGARDADDPDEADSTLSGRQAPPPYHVVDVGNSGAIVGRVTLASPDPGDTSFTASDSAASYCGPTRRVPLVYGRGDNVQDVVIWLSDVRAGKRLPIERRYELTNSDCLLEPRVQAAVEGGMLNVRNADRSAHRTIFLRGGDTVSSVRETEEGQVVPTGRPLAHRGLVRVRSDRYPWSRAWIRVFDHPYFAVTNRDGIFTIDSVPPGDYTLKMWEPRLGVRERKVHVDAAKDSKLDLSY